jgi:hypothetical protein
MILNEKGAITDKRTNNYDESVNTHFSMPYDHELINASEVYEGALIYLPDELRFFHAFIVDCYDDEVHCYYEILDNNGLIQPEVIFNKNQKVILVEV